MVALKNNMETPRRMVFALRFLNLPPKLRENHQKSISYQNNPLVLEYFRQPAGNALLKDGYASFFPDLSLESRMGTKISN